MDGPFKTTRLTTNPDGDVTLVASSVESDGDSEYVKLPENLPMRSSNTPETKDHIQEHIDTISQPTALFTHPDELYFTDLANTETTPTKNHRDNGALPPLVTQQSSPKSPMTVVSVA